ncbi:Ammonium Transporter Family protein [Geobacillus sp. BCO2]|nr:Ammonium Transporter Family protein [Geobacillus sp. BCO2]
MFGTLAVGLFDSTQGLLTTGHASLFITQLLGALTVIVWGFVSGALIANVCDSTVGLRATEREEEEGLDMAYHAFRLTMNSSGLPISRAGCTILRRRPAFALLR